MWQIGPGGQAMRRPLFPVLSLYLAGVGCFEGLNGSLRFMVWCSLPYEGKR